MLDDLVPMVVIGIIVYGIYRLFELFVRRPERMAIIEKIGEKMDPLSFNGKIDLSTYTGNRFSSLKFAMLLIGLGVGLFIGFLVLGFSGYHGNHDQEVIIYGCCMMIFGGLGLLISYNMEREALEKNKDK